ncbi:MAG: alanyl-tRNA editing protein [Anaerolineales bacterium]|nr:alanyl-tRNA editing protein [Anaerolineales bacterium]
MNHKRYYHDAYTTHFTATAVSTLSTAGRHGLILDETYFYPTSGGQPHDTGRLNGIPVVDVTLREDDDAIVHWLAAPLPPGPVTAEIDWPRRFDHMQQHTGQHILSQAFIRVADAPTLSFHLGDDSVTVDLDTAVLAPDQLTAAEALANQIIWENRPVQMRIVSRAEAQQLPLRKIPPTRDDSLRLIDIDGFDLTACGGTHVARTGAVGLLKLLKLERIRGSVRVVFACGRRALQDYAQKHAVLADLSAQLTTGIAEFPQTVQRLQDDLKAAQRTEKQLQTALLAHEAAQLSREAPRHGDVTLVTAVFDADTDGRDAAQLRQLASQLTQQPRTVALLGLAGAKSFLLFSRGADAPGDMNRLLQPALQQLGGRGGGTAVTAQGGGPAATTAQVHATLATVQTQILSHLKA